MVEKIKNIFNGKKIDLARYMMSSPDAKILLTVALTEQMRKRKIDATEKRYEQKQ